MANTTYAFGARCLSCAWGTSAVPGKFCRKEHERITSAARRHAKKKPGHRVDVTLTRTYRDFGK